METENYSISTKYQELAAEVIEKYDELNWLLCTDVRIDFISSLKDKKKSGRPVLGECMLVKEIYKCYVPYDFLIVIYEPNVHGLTDEQMKILLYHELLHVDVTDVEGEPQYKVAPHDIEDFRAIINKFGMDWAD